MPPVTGKAASTSSQPATIEETLTTSQPDDADRPAAPGIEPSASDPIAVFTYVEGEVIVEDPVAAHRTPGLLVLAAPMHKQAQPFQQIRDGSTVRADANARTTIVCTNSRVIVIRGPGSVVVNRVRCNRGVAMPGGSSTRVSPDYGRIAVNHGRLDLQGETREKESDYGNLPIIINPRNTQLMEAPPAIRWVETPGALEYVLSLSGPGLFDDVPVDATSITCEEDERTAPNQICGAPWPAAWVLAPGKRYFLTSSARISIASPLRASESSSLRTAALDVAVQVQDETTATLALTLDPVTTDLLLAGLFAEQGLYAQAIPLYEKVVAIQPAPELLVTLGDAYRAVDLQRFAYRSYQAALEGSNGNPAVRAAAAFGMGQVEYSRGNFANAEPHFVRAVDLYKELGATVALGAAQLALDEARRRQ